MEDLDAFIQNNKHYILSLNPEENFWQTGEIDKLYNNSARYDDALLKMTDFLHKNNDTFMILITS